MQIRHSLTQMLAFFVIPQCITSSSCLVLHNAYLCHAQMFSSFKIVMQVIYRSDAAKRQV